MREFLIALSFILIGCSSTKPLNYNGLNAQERRFYIIQNGREMSPKARECFMEVKPMIGMHKEHIFMLFGSPSYYDEKRNVHGGLVREIWTYTEDLRDKDIKTYLKIIFNKYQEVISIYGENIEKCKLSDEDYKLLSWKPNLKPF